MEDSHDEDEGKEHKESGSVYLELFTESSPGKSMAGCSSILEYVYFHFTGTCVKSSMLALYLL